MGGGISKIIPGIYVGGLTAAKSDSYLNKHSITHVCSVLHMEEQPKISNRPQIVFPASDSPDENISRYFEDACLFIHEARVNGGSVLIHCACGVSRSVTITLAYLLVITEFPLRNLFKAIQGARHCACPNSGFVQQLVDFELTGLKAVRTKLFERFGEWPADKREADRVALTEALNVQEYYLQHGVYPGEKSLANAAEVDDPSLSQEAQGKAVMEQAKIPVSRLSQSFYTVYSQGKPMNFSEFISSRSRPLGEQDQ